MLKLISIRTYYGVQEISLSYSIKIIKEAETQDVELMLKKKNRVMHGKKKLKLHLAMVK